MQSPPLVITPVAPRQPAPIGAPPPVDARPQLPPPPAGSQLLAPAVPDGPDAGQALPGFRLSSQVPREVAERIAQFMRTGALNREPFSFAPLSHVQEAEPALTPEQQSDLAVASLIAEAAPHMRLSESMLFDAEIADGGLFASAQAPSASPTDAATAARTQAAIRQRATLQRPSLVPLEPQTQPVGSGISRGAANPLFEPPPPDDLFGEDEIWPQSRIA